MDPVPSLTDRERAILDFEETYKRGGAKEEAVRQAFGLSAARYYQLLNRLIDTRAALSERPFLVYRLREERDRRTAARKSRAYRRPE